MTRHGDTNLTLIFAQASCVDSVPRNSFTNIDPRYCRTNTKKVDKMYKSNNKPHTVYVCKYVYKRMYTRPPQYSDYPFLFQQSGWDQRARLSEERGLGLVRQLIVRAAVLGCLTCDLYRWVGSAGIFPVLFCSIDDSCCLLLHWISGCVCFGPLTTEVTVSSLCTCLCDLFTLNQWFHEEPFTFMEPFQVLYNGIF